MITIKTKGDFKKTAKFLDKLLKLFDSDILDYYGRKGVEALSSATPKDSGKTSESWDYEIIKNGKKASLRWFNTNVNDGVNIAIILQYGHGTGTGGYVVGRDYINPAIQPIFDEIAKSIWKEVTG